MFMCTTGGAETRSQLTWRYHGCSTEVHSSSGSSRKEKCHRTGSSFFLCITSHHCKLNNFSLDKHLKTSPWNLRIFNDDFSLFSNWPNKWIFDLISRMINNNTTALYFVPITLKGNWALHIPPSQSKNRLSTQHVQTWVNILRNVGVIFVLAHRSTHVPLCLVFSFFCPTLYGSSSLLWYYFKSFFFFFYFILYLLLSESFVLSLSLRSLLNLTLQNSADWGGGYQK